MDKAIFTHELYQNELTPDDMEYIPDKHQPYFEFEINGEKHLIGLNKILECLVIADKIGEIPKLGNTFWMSIFSKFGINYFDYDIKLSQK